MDIVIVIFACIGLTLSSQLIGWAVGLGISNYVAKKEKTNELDN